MHVQIDNNCSNCIHAHGKVACAYMEKYKDLIQAINSVRMVKQEPFKKPIENPLPFYVAVACDWFYGGNQ